MESYSFFAGYYDELMSDVDYESIASYYLGLIGRYGVKDGILLDLAGGTGSLSVLFSEAGFDVICVDASPEMLSLARIKADEKDMHNILFLCQYMQGLELYGSVDCAVCALDSINHMADSEDVEKTFIKVSRYMRSGGVFVFDVNTPYKHEKVLSDNAFVFEKENVLCVWQNQYIPEETSTDIFLDFFVEDKNGKYDRYSEEFTERAYTEKEISGWLIGAGFEIMGIYDEWTESPILEDGQRAVYVAVKK